MENIQTHHLDVYPIVQQYMKQLGLYELFNEHLPLVKGQAVHADCLCVLIANLIISTQPLYKISEWLQDYTDGKGEFGYQANHYTDDRLGNTLDALFDADRHSLMSLASSKAIEQYDLETKVVHNDSTSISLSGHYHNTPDLDSVTPKRGYNKDGRPDAKQIVFNLNVIGDGHIPILASFHDGNTQDSETHIPNWNAVKELLKQEDFIYIADSKVATIENMAHINKHNGQFISILPGSRSEVKTFLTDLLSTKKQLEWTIIHTKKDPRNKQKQIIYKAYSADKTKEGYALHWIHSSSKAEQDTQRREKNLLNIEANLNELNANLNKYYLKEKEQIEIAVSKILGKNYTFFDIQILENQTIKRTKIGRGRIGKNSKFKEEIIISYTLNWTRVEQEIKKQSRIDGIFPLVTNTKLSAKKVLEHYKNQPYLEKKFYTLKSVLKVVPIFLNLPHRIEAMLFLYFMALMVIALMERQVQLGMEEKKIEDLPILPQKAKTEKPTWNNIRYFFRQVHFLARQVADNQIVTLTKGLTKLHQTILKLLNVPLHIYQINDVSWWKFNSD